MTGFLGRATRGIWIYVRLTLMLQYPLSSYCVWTHGSPHSCHFTSAWDIPNTSAAAVTGGAHTYLQRLPTTRDRELEGDEFLSRGKLHSILVTLWLRVIFKELKPQPPSYFEGYEASRNRIYVVVGIRCSRLVVILSIRVDEEQSHCCNSYQCCNSLILHEFTWPVNPIYSYKWLTNSIFILTLH